MCFGAVLYYTSIVLKNELYDKIIDDKILTKGIHNPDLNVTKQIIV